MPPTVKPGPRATASLARGVGGQDRLGRAPRRRRRERGGRLGQAGQHAVQRQRRADHAGREDEHLLGVEVEQPRGLGGGRARVELAALARGGVGDARVDDDGLRLRELEVLARDLDRAPPAPGSP